MIKVLVVDDHALVRAGFRMILDAQDDMTVVGEAEDGELALRRCRELLPEVVLMDLHMPRSDGITATGAITSELPDVRVLALSTFDLDEYVVDALRAGASGFLPKDISPEELVEGVRVVHRGDSAVAPRLLTRLIGTFVRAAEPRRRAVPEQLAGLTDREREVLTLIARGRSNGEICESLGMAASTVKNHVTSLFAKTGVRDRAQAVIVAYETGLVSPGD
ncbi:DNA-binding response regulator [Microtetraspora sp. NBRC 13810]|uniref:response regulator transcription factor n=1 Tax=Microtetraspora sp. NBRC 13810 TaxID=3030990 RepID=UPI0024A367E9|nr:response regulator transcription factor [Microtetraspora sp. NBRC 13810]GLW06461.1 DNA-binding response regulator [Microtetraspora sp. NBRC 13810]